MRRGRILIFLLLIVVVGVAVLAVGLGLFNPTAPVVSTQEATGIKVYFAAQRIPQGAPITQDLLRTDPIPQGLVTEFMFTEGEEANLIGQTARFTLEPGTLITSSMVGAAPGDLPGPRWATLVPAGMVAVGIPTNRLATAAYGINDGAHVNVNACMTFVDVDPAYQSILPNYVSVMRDVYFPENDRPFLSIEPLTLELPARQGRVELDPTFAKPIYTVPSEAQRPRLVCQMVLQDVIVLNLGNFELVAVTDPNTTPSPAQVQQEAAPDIITLMVTPQDSIALNYFVYSGAVISMTLRNPNDNSRIEAQSATLTSILTQYNISLPSKLPYAQQPRLDVLAPPLLRNDVINAQPQQ
ncbi:MAG TPA: SAF domain-containing protein [Anaerolineales bacterium]|nr:SAF domain-containing protein [Anaerolineales bacterium]